MKLFIAIFILCIAFCGGAKAQFEHNPCIPELPEGYDDLKSAVFKENKKRADRGDPMAMYVVSQAYLNMYNKTGKDSYRKKFCKIRDKAMSYNIPEILWAYWEKRFANIDGWRKVLDLWRMQNTGESNYRCAYTALCGMEGFKVPEIRVEKDKRIDFSNEDLDPLHVKHHDGTGSESNDRFYRFATSYFEYISVSMHIPDMMTGIKALNAAVNQEHSLAKLAKKSIVFDLQEKLQSAYEIKDSLDLQELNTSIVYSLYFSPLIGTDWLPKYLRLLETPYMKRKLSLCIGACEKNYRHYDDIRKKRYIEDYADDIYMLGWWYFVTGERDKSIQLMKESANWGNRWAKLHIEILDNYNFNF